MDRKYKLICFDLDGTLVDDTVFIWHTLHEYFKTDITQRKAKADEFFSGAISYAEWAGWEVEEWKKKGACKARFMEAISSLSQMEGAKDTLDELKKRGYILAIISGSLSFVVERVFPDYQDYFSDVLINWVFFDDEGMIARTEFTDFDIDRKADGLRYLASKHGITTKECIFIGDHNNDLTIAQEAGFSIAFNSKSERLNAIADVVVNGKDLRRILDHI